MQDLPMRCTASTRATFSYQHSESGLSPPAGVKRALHLQQIGRLRSLPLLALTLLATVFIII